MADIEFEVSIQPSHEANVSIEPSHIVEINLIGTGPRGPKGDKGDEGEVTKESVISALGYTPVSDSEILILDGGTAKEEFDENT